MARGRSGRIVIEVDPSLKSDLYAALARESLTLRAWFVERASSYLATRYQLSLFVAEPSSSEYATNPKQEEPR